MKKINNWIFEYQNFDLRFKFSDSKKFHVLIFIEN